MKFHYWKSLLAIFFVAFIFWILFATMLPIDPLTLVRSQNREVIEYLTEAQTNLANGRTAMSTNVPAWLRNARQNVDASLVVIGDQSENLKQIAEAKLGPDMQTVGATLASIVVILGTLSTIILSWRKDMRDARREIEQIQSQTSNSKLS